MSFGFGYRRLPNDFFICEVNDNSPASDACLQKGDRILFINDKSVNDLNFDESIKLIVSSPHELKLTVKYEIERFKECWNLLSKLEKKCGYNRFLYGKYNLFKRRMEIHLMFIMTMKMIMDLNFEK